MVTLEDLPFNSSMRNGMCLVLLEKSQWSRFNGIYFVSFEFIKMWEISKFKRFLSLQIQINYKNEVLEGKINWECGHTCKTYLNLQKLDIECKVQGWI
jgi:hypothetical protein